MAMRRTTITLVTLFFMLIRFETVNTKIAKMYLTQSLPAGE